MDRIRRMTLMRHQYIYLCFGLLLFFTGCSEDNAYEASSSTTAADSTGVTTLTTSRNDGKISLAIDAESASRSGVWIDLNGDGIRAKDASEDVKTFEDYVDYTLPEGLKKITIHGNMTYLGCTADSLTAIDVSADPYLKILNCPQNKLTSIDVSKNSLLEKLDCSENRISTLDLSANTALLSLWCYNNKLNDLDISRLTNLASLDCSGNQLTALDVTNNLLLERLLCYNNRITALDLSKNPQLNRLWIFGNSFTENECAKIVVVLKNVVKGSLWMPEGKMDETLKSSLSTKGWILQ